MLGNCAVQLQGSTKRLFCLIPGNLFVAPPEGRASKTMRIPLTVAQFPFLLHVLFLVDVYQIIAFQSTCANNFAASSLEVITAGIGSAFTITATDYPGHPCTLGSELFGFNLKSPSGNFSLLSRSSSQWSVTPPNQFILPFSAITSSGIYSAEVVRFGKRGSRFRG
jgi:hypothetical protein